MDKKDKLIEQLRIEVKALEERLRLIEKLSELTPRVGLFGPTKEQMDRVKPHERGVVEFVTD